MNFYDAYFNDEVIDFLGQCSIHILKTELITADKAFEPAFRLHCRNHTYFAKFSSFGRFSDVFLSELSEIDRVNGGNLHLPVLSKNIESINRQLNIYEWINGNNLKSILNGASEKTISEYGCQCGDLLRKIHMKMKYPSDYCEYIVRSFDEYTARLGRGKFVFERQFDYCRFFHENCRALLRGNNTCFVHMDFKPKNLMICDGRITVVDLDSCRVGNPWMDFYDKAFPLSPEKEKFNNALIRSYFEDDVPDDFWKYFKVLSVYALVQNTAWLLQYKDIKYIRLIESYLWNSYDGFKKMVPEWMS